ncbi:MAG TPA: DUF349 domain-containing protein [Candidatus Alistipes excrementipullorum]|nr:DUF349 domain-containing protein [Candidatus Alistipes excrementipullorum]
MAAKKTTLTASDEIIVNAEDMRQESATEPVATTENDMNAGNENAGVEAPAGDAAGKPIAEEGAVSAPQEQTTDEAPVAAEEVSDGPDADEEIPEGEPDAEEAMQDSVDVLAGKSKAELVELFEKILAEKSVQAIRREVEALKVAFYKLHRADVEAARKAFAELEGEEAEFVPQVDALEVKFKDLLKEYRRRRDEYTANLDHVKEENYKAKLQIIEELKELVNSDETLNTTFARFRELQQRWKDIGMVPQQYVKDLWETYDLHVENFYNFIKINKELRDLDLRKNYETKLSLCEQAEALADEPSIVEAFHKLQKLHDDWRETGPVANEYKEPLWERFKEASARVNKRHQEFFENIKKEQVHNLELKDALCVKAEALASQSYSTRKEWNRASEKLLDIQKEWKGIGFAPRKDNNRIYERFRAACDKFFELKREFYSGVKDEMDNNLKLKTEICEAAEALKQSEEWKKATDRLISLQARWKEIGPVSRRYSDAVWKRFRAACDEFFDRKAKHFASVDGEYDENLSRKKALLEEMKTADVKEGGYDMIKEFQRRWSEIGFVPIKFKEQMQKQYKEALDRLFGELRGSEHDRSINRFKDKISSMKATGDKRLRTERDRLYNKVRQLEQEIALLENNIGFFSKSKNTESMIADVKAKIEKAKREMNEAIEKVKMIDENKEQ